jgi:hypothetical protein
MGSGNYGAERIFSNQHRRNAFLELIAQNDVRPALCDLMKNVKAIGQ